MPIYEVEVLADAVITELWRVEAADVEEAEEIYGSHGDFIEQTDVCGEDNREVEHVTEITPEEAVPAQAVRDARALNQLAAHLRETRAGRGGDFCELAAIEIEKTGRPL